ncbi:MAG: lipoate--protein ligase family protein [Candidatus Kryptoniota bacterium]
MLTNWRLILTSPAAGDWNMAVDEAILEAVGRDLAPPTLRLYAWQPPCLSLGYAQPITDVDLAALAISGWQLVRRPTGGRAILHIDELTYSVIAPHSEPRLQGSVLESYQRLAQALLKALHLLGIPAQAHEIATPPAPNPAPRDANTHTNQSAPPATLNPICFEVPSNYEIVVEGKKIIGSAQARRKEGVLQHGSFPLFGDITRILQVLSFNDESSRQKAATRLAQRATTAEIASGRFIEWEEAARAFIHAFEDTLQIRLVRSDLSAAELVRADELVREKYSTLQWNHRMAL